MWGKVTVAYAISALLLARVALEVCEPADTCPDLSFLPDLSGSLLTATGDAHVGEFKAWLFQLLQGEQSLFQTLILLGVVERILESFLAVYYAVRVFAWGLKTLISTVMWTILTIGVSLLLLRAVQSSSMVAEAAH